MPFVTSSDAKRDFTRLCSRVLDNGRRIFVRDKSGSPFMTIDNDPRGLVYVEVSAQFFKDNFSRCASLVKSGISFRMTSKAGRTAYVRRHTGYDDPLDPILDAWRANIVTEALDAQKREITALAEEVREARDETREEVRHLALGIARMAIGHLPFKEGVLPSGFLTDARSEQHEELDSAASQ